MKALPANERINHFDEVYLGYTKDEAMMEAGRCMKCKKMFCSESCPIHQDIGGYSSAIAEGDFDKALKIIIDKNPMPGSLGRVCAHPCQKGCLRGKKGDAMQVMFLKRAASDYGEAKWPQEPATGKKVAVIGSGPAGLLVASDLARKGHKVKVFERERELGGMLRYCIPAYRLPRETINRDIQRIRDMGVEFETQAEFNGKYHRVLSLLYDGGYDAVFIGVGTYKPKMMNIPGENMPGVFHAVPFLLDYHRTGKNPLGRSVAVIGGGNSAMDAVRVAKRLGADAFLVYRRERAQMPAADEEIDDCEAEGVHMKLLTNPVEVKGTFCVQEMTCISMKLGEPDESGRAKPVPIDGSEFKICAESIVEAVSQEPDLSFINPKDFKLSKWNTFVVDENGMTTVKGIFAGGDCVNGPSTIVEAMASARKAADGIHRYIMAK
jgi:glutamate synthase (NADPH/NADH) small chain